MTYKFRKYGIIGLKINNKQAIDHYFITQKMFRSEFTLPVSIAMQKATNFLETHASADWSKIVFDNYIT